MHKAVVRDVKRAETPRTARARKTPTPDSPFLRNDIPRVPRRHDIGDSLTRVLFRPPCETLEVGASDPSNETRVAIATANVAVELWRTPHGECAVPSAGGRKWRRGVRARRFFFVPIVHGSVPGLRICFVSQLDSLPKAWRSLGPESHTSATSFCAHVALLLAHSFSRQPFAMAAGTVAMATAAPVSLFRSGQRGPRVTSRRVSCCRPSRGVVTAAASVEAVPGNSAALVALKGVTLRRASDGTSVDACAIVPTTGRVVVPFLTQFADFDSWELAQRLVDDLPALAEAGVTVVAVGIGSVEAARLFCEKTNFPVDKLFADATGDAYAALKFEPGFGRQGGEFGWLDTKPFSFVNGYAKLLIMCAGIGSPGTLGAVFGGYVVSISHSPHSASLIAHTRLTLFLLQSGGQKQKTHLQGGQQLRQPRDSRCNGRDPG